MKSKQLTQKQKAKQKLLKKYLSGNQTKKSFQKQNAPSNFFIRDNQQSNDNSSLQDSKSESASQQNIQPRKKRIQSSQDEHDQNQILKKKIVQKKLANNQSQNQNIFTNKKLLKKFRKAFGIEDPQQLQQFLKQMKIQGMDIKQIKKLLKSKKVQLKIQQNSDNQKTKKEKKKNKKQQKKEKKKKDKLIKEQDQKKIKFQSMLAESQSSDIQVPDQARTIYRNKDGTIKLQTQNQIKEKKKKQVYDRLAEWEKGMKPQDSDKQDDEDLAHAKNNVWDDPLKLWNQQNLIKPFQCKYQGPGNRFNIKPGHRWDGVIRGNGFQNRLIQQQNLRKAKQSRQNKQYLKNL